MNLVTVIITNYNYREYLNKALESVISQTYKPLECIVIDDASTDGSKEWIMEARQQYQGRLENFQTVFSSQNKGKLHLLNRSLPAVNGEFVLVLDADDYLGNEFLKITIAQLKKARLKDGKVAFIYTDSYLINHKAEPLGIGRSKPFNRETLYTHSFIPDCSPTYTAALKQILPFDESIRVGTKHHKWLKMVQQGYKGFYLRQPLFYYRMHNRNLSGIGNKILTNKGHNGRSDEVHHLSQYWPTANQMD